MMDLRTLLRAATVLPVLTIHDATHARPLAEILARAGLQVIEVTLRTQAALAAIAEMAAVPGIVVGAGTVLAERQLDAAVAAGARFAVSPGLTEGLAAAAVARGVPLLPGVATSSDIMRGLDLGLELFKFFPAEALGGPAALDALSAPFSRCRFCPTGGITAASAPAYLELATVDCVGGSWMVPQQLVTIGNWDMIARLAREAAALRAT